MLYFDLDSSTAELTYWLRERKYLGEEESIQSLEKPGDGNMNVVLRLKTNKGTLILKQSRPFVNKYPDIPAPLDRIDVEFQFYQAIHSTGIRRRVPSVLAYDAKHHLLLLEDLGKGEDLTTSYSDRHFAKEDVGVLLEFLNQVHQCQAKTFPANLSLRQLNHQHIFVLPFLENNGFGLDDVQDGLQELSLSYKTDKKLRSIIHSLGERYLSEGKTLLHGDYYPGSWLRSEEQLFVIDPEFSFLGFPEFDLGVMAAHLILITGDSKQLEICLSGYGLPIREKLTQQIAGTEMMRRLIGLAQLPLKRDIEEKADLLGMAKNMITV